MARGRGSYIFPSSAHFLIGYLVYILVVVELFVYFGNKPLSAALFANIFFQSIGVFVLFMVTFAV